MKRNLLKFLLIVVIGAILYTCFILVYTLAFDGRLPGLSEFFPLTAVLVTGFPLLLKHNRKP